MVAELLVTQVLIVLVCAIATWQIVDIARHSEMDLIANFRAKHEDSDTFFGKMFTCPWCLSVWVGFVTYALFDGAFVMDAYATAYNSKIFEILAAILSIVKLLITGLSVSRVANLANDYFYTYTRTHDNYQTLEEEEEVK